LGSGSDQAEANGSIDAASLRQTLSRRRNSEALRKIGDLAITLIGNVADRLGVGGVEIGEAVQVVHS